MALLRLQHTHTDIKRGTRPLDSYILNQSQCGVPHFVLHIRYWNCWSIKTVYR